jgi:NAD(P)-dependent dehydrogenase (short-subunit alcohol dehydrogenase family)
MPSPELFSLQGRTAIVTGATRGIGRAIASGLAEAGASVSIVSRKVEACRSTVEELEVAGHRAIACPGHMGSAEDIERIVTATVEQLGGIDIVVNNAATALSEPLGEITESAMAKAIDVNLRGPILLLQAATPHLRRSPHASVINVVSAGVWMFLPDVSIYSATKAGLVAFTRSAAAALWVDGIRVNALAPGVVDTDKRETSPDELYDRLVGSAVMNRAATPEEMVGPAVFLASEASSYMTGAVLHVDGGTVAS